MNNYEKSCFLESQSNGKKPLGPAEWYRVSAFISFLSCRHLNRLGSTSLVVVDLLARLTSLVGPGEVSDWDDEEAVAAIGNTGKGVVPGNEGSKDTKDTTGLDAAGVGRAGAVLEVTNSEHQECKVKGEEQREERDGRAQSTDQQEEGKDEPSLYELSEMICVGFLAAEDLPSRKVQRS